MYPNPNDVLRNPPEDDKKYFGKPMPTNNQEKWIDELKKEFQVIEKGTIDGKPYELANDDIYGSLPDLISFISQEIRQAKIDRDKEIATLLENTVMQHVEDSNNSLHVRYLKKIISNLKQNDNTTKN